MWPYGSIHNFTKWIDHFYLIGHIQISDELLSLNSWLTDLWMRLWILTCAWREKKYITRVLRNVSFCCFALVLIKKVPKQTNKEPTIAYGIHSTHLDQDQMHRWRVHCMTRHVLFSILYFMDWPSRTHCSTTTVCIRAYISPQISS